MHPRVGGQGEPSEATGAGGEHEAAPQSPAWGLGPGKGKQVSLWPQADTLSPCGAREERRKLGPNRIQFLIPWTVTTANCRGDVGAVASVPWIRTLTRAVLGRTATEAQAARLWRAGRRPSRVGGQGVDGGHPSNTCLALLPPGSSGDSFQMILQLG